MENTIKEPAQQNATGEYPETLFDLLPLVTCHECGQDVPDTHAQISPDTKKVVCTHCLEKPEINFYNH